MKNQNQDLIKILSFLQNCLEKVEKFNKHDTDDTTDNDSTDDEPPQNVR